jgi:hypothetical protein
MSSTIKLLLLATFLTSGACLQAQETFDIMFQNRKLTTDTTLEFEVMVRSNGSTGLWAMRSFQCGYSFDSLFVNGGTLKGKYIPGSSEVEPSFNPVWGFSFNTTRTVLNQSTNTGSSCPGALIGTKFRLIGRFQITNSVKWGCRDDGMRILQGTQSGVLSLAVSKYNSTDCSVVGVTNVSAGATVIVAPKIKTVTASSCDSYIWNGVTYTQSGIYFFNTGSCPIQNDTLNLTIDTANSWTGTISEDWHDPLNWNCSSVPDSNTNVVINAGTPFAPEIRILNAVCKSLYINPAATIRVANGRRLSVLQN